MRRLIIVISPLALLLLALGSVSGQGTIQVTFDGPPEMPPGTARSWSYDSESGVSVMPGNFTRRWSGDPVFPDNGTAYLQSRGSEMFFDYTRTFAAVSVDMALYSAASLDPVTVQFVASGYSGDIIATTEFTVSGIVDNEGRPAFQTFHFPPEFRRMYYLSITPTGPAGPFWSLDNLVIYIPEPSGLALLAVGGGGLLAVRWRRGCGCG